MRADVPAGRSLRATPRSADTLFAAVRPALSADSAGFAAAPDFCAPPLAAALPRKENSGMAALPAGTGFFSSASRTAARGSCCFFSARASRTSATGAFAAFFTGFPNKSVMSNTGATFASGLTAGTLGRSPRPSAAFPSTVSAGAAFSSTPPVPVSAGTSAAGASAFSLASACASSRAGSVFSSFISSFVSSADFAGTSAGASEIAGSETAFVSALCVRASEISDVFSAPSFSCFSSDRVSTAAACSRAASASFSALDFLPLLRGAGFTSSDFSSAGLSSDFSATFVSTVSTVSAGFAAAAASEAFPVRLPRFAAGLSASAAAGAPAVSATAVSAAFAAVPVVFFAARPRAAFSAFSEETAGLSAVFSSLPACPCFFSLFSVLSFAVFPLSFFSAAGAFAGSFFSDLFSFPTAGLSSAPFSFVSEQIPASKRISPASSIRLSAEPSFPFKSFTSSVSPGYFSIYSFAETSKSSFHL